MDPSEQNAGCPKLTGLLDSGGFRAGFRLPDAQRIPSPFAERSTGQIKDSTLFDDRAQTIREVI